MRKLINILAGGMFLCGLLFLFFSVRENQPYRKANIEKKILCETVVLNDRNQKEDSPLERKIDFGALNEMNPDIAAWIYVPGTSIDYPVLIGKTDTEYLNKNFKGEKSALGAIFGFSDTARDFQDAHICLFGHNMRSAQMFGELKQYKKEVFAKNHRKLYCYTREGVREYRLFSVYECEKTDFTFKHKMPRASEEFESLYNRMIEKSVVELEGMQQAADGQIITLSCCSDYQRTINRMTVHFCYCNQRNKDL